MTFDADHAAPGGTVRLRDTKRLRACLDADFAELRAAVAGAPHSARVPSCPDWSVVDLARHVGTVYLHKVECMRLGAQPDPWPPAGIPAEDPVELLDRAFAALNAEFDRREPNWGAFTWYDPEQTVEFWIRRMAQETVIHRVDAQLAAGVPVTAIPTDLAIDGIDELLVAFLDYGSRTWYEDFAPVLTAADGTIVRIKTPDAAWLIRLTAQGVLFELSPVDDADRDAAGHEASALVTAPSETMLLWLWNRAADDMVSLSGDPAAISALRDVIRTATQ